jgi:uncharacterized protein YbjT (DUF2867 family)
VKAVIVGASGLVGSSLIKKLLADPTIEKVISFSRRSLEFSHPKLEEVITSGLDELDNFSNQLSGDLYFCCLGTTIKTAGSKENFKKVDLDAVIKFAKIAQEHHVKSFVVISSMGADSNSIFFYNKIKGQMEEAISSLGLTSLSIFRPSLLIGERAEKRVVESLAIKTFHALEVVLPTKLKLSLGTSVDALSSKMLATAKSMKAGVEILQAQEI